MYVKREGQVFTFHDPIEDADWEHTFPDDVVFDDALLHNWRESCSTRPIIADFPFLTEEQVAWFTFGVSPKNYKEYLLGIVDEPTTEAA
jgi:hypothetical protein